MNENGEELFERLCASLHLASERIPEAANAGEQRPDYRVIGSDGSEFLAEVKLISPNNE